MISTKSNTGKGLTIVEVVILLVIISIFAVSTIFVISRMSNNKNDVDNKSESPNTTDNSSKNDFEDDSNESLKLSSANNARLNDTARLLGYINEHIANNNGYKLVGGVTTICGSVTDACPDAKTQDNIDISEARFTIFTTGSKFIVASALEGVQKAPDDGDYTTVIIYPGTTCIDSKATTAGANIRQFTAVLLKETDSGSTPICMEG